MRQFIRFLFYKPILWLVETFSSSPDRERIFDALSILKKEIEERSDKKGIVIDFNADSKFIIFSDQHKGRRNGADDFAIAEPCYLRALQYYNVANFHLIALGDCEELWENTMLQVLKHNQLSFEAEKKFLVRKSFTKIFGNHDLDWDIDPLAPVFLKQIFGREVKIHKGVILRTKLNGRELQILCTHGHQGDLQSDGNWFSKMFVAKVWAPLQSYLTINPNTPSYDLQLKTIHNRFMYQWSAAQKNLILITGHTHQPVFESLTHVERVTRKQKQALYEHNKEWAEALEVEMNWARKEDLLLREDYLHMLPSYFNTGCCCFADGDITGIEIADGFIRLIKWENNEGNIERIVLEQTALDNLSERLSAQE